MHIPSVCAKYDGIIVIDSTSFFCIKSNYPSVQFNSLTTSKNLSNSQTLMSKRLEALQLPTGEYLAICSNIYTIKNMIYQQCTTKMIKFYNDIVTITYIKRIELFLYSSVCYIWPM